MALIYDDDGGATKYRRSNREFMTMMNDEREKVLIIGQISLKFQQQQHCSASTSRSSSNFLLLQTSSINNSSIATK